jgi:hypothetical protein
MTTGRKACNSGLFVWASAGISVGINRFDTFWVMESLFLIHLGDQGKPKASDNEL